MSNPTESENSAENSTEYFEEIKKEPKPQTVDPPEGSKDTDSNMKKSGKLTKSALASALKANNPTNTTRSDVGLIDSDRESVLTKYTFYWNSVKENDKLYSVIIELPHFENVLEAIRDVIPYFNQKLAEDGSSLILNVDPQLYDLYKAKKNGQAKTDYPALDSKQILSQSGLLQVTLLEKDINSAIISKINSSPVKRGSVETKSSMIDPSIPAKKLEEVAYEDVEITEYVCFCIPKKKTIRRPKTNISLENQPGQNSLNEKLLAQ